MPRLGEFTVSKHAALTAQGDLHTPKLHASRHENGEPDEISVAGLSGDLADAQDPKAHASSHQNGESDEIDLAGLSGQEIWVPYNGKIADITESDTNKHTLTLSTPIGETRTIIAVLVNSARATGTGNLIVYPNEGTSTVTLQLGRTNLVLVVIAAGSNRLQYSQSVANDDFDLYCCGYVVRA